MQNTKGEQERRQLVASTLLASTGGHTHLVPSQAVKEATGGETVYEPISKEYRRVLAELRKEDALVRKI